MEQEEEEGREAKKNSGWMCSWHLHYSIDYYYYRSFHYFPVVAAVASFDFSSLFSDWFHSYRSLQKLVVMGSYDYYFEQQRVLLLMQMMVQ